MERTLAKAAPWLEGGEGVIAKQLDAPYRPGERKGMVKVKRVRTADCVVVGWRPGKEEGTVGSLILGLYDRGELRVVGHTSGFGPRRSASWSPSWLRTRRASGAPAIRADGRATATSSGSRCARSSSWR